MKVVERFPEVKRVYDKDNPDYSPSLEEVYQSAVEILHKDVKSQHPTSNVYYLMNALRREFYPQESWKELYRKLTVEAYQYAAESGSEYALVWLFNCTCKMFVYIKDDVNFHLVILVSCGFILCNLIFDMKSRYAYMHNTQQTFFELLEEYNRQANSFERVYEDIDLQIQTRILMLFRYLFGSMLDVNVFNRNDAEFAVGGLRYDIDRYQSIAPDFLKALCCYQEGIIGSWKSRWSLAKRSFSSSFDLLKIHFKEDSMQAVFCYNALHEFISICTRQVEGEMIGQMEIKAMYEELKRDYLVQEFDQLPRECIYQLALMRMALALGEIDDIKLYCNNLKLYVTVSDLVKDKGISGEWAFTVLNYVLAAHCRLVRIDPNKAFLLCDFIFKNFAYKLRGPKRLAFMATLFVGLHYDFQWNEGERRVIGIGNYVVNKFLIEKYLEIPECRVYLAFVLLCLASIYAMMGNKSKSWLTISIIMELKRGKANSLWEFILMMNRFIKAGVYMSRSNAQIRDFGKPLCQNRYEKAIVATRLHEILHPETESAIRWKSYVYQ